MATVTTRPPACRTATVAPARSIWQSSQPPKISPCGLVSAGMAMVRIAGSVSGGTSTAVEVAAVGSDIGLQSALMDANWTTLAHLAISSVTNLLNWAVVIGVDSTPKATRRDLNVVLPPAATIAAASLATMSRGGPAGAGRPYHTAAPQVRTQL